MPCEAFVLIAEFLLPLTSHSTETARGELKKLFLMKKRIVLVGTRRTYQYGAGNAWNREAPCTPEDEQAFRQMLTDVATKQNVVCIAEEMNEDGLAEAKKSESVPQIIAGILDLPYVFCEPNRQERVDLGVTQENDIRIFAFMNEKTSEYVEAALKDQFHRRESFWLDRIEAIGTWPVLFICGANHVPSFTALLQETGVECEVLYHNWEA